MKMTHKPTLDIVVNPLLEKGLSPRQEKFALIYATTDGITQTEAARQAGYPNDNAAHVAHHLIRKPKVLARIEEIKSELAKKYEVTFDNHVRKLAEIRDKALEAGNYPAAVTAEKSRGQVAGLYVERKEILMGRLDQMSREDVMREIEKMQRDFPVLAPASHTLELRAQDVTDVAQEEDDAET